MFDLPARDWPKVSLLVLFISSKPYGTKQSIIGERYNISRSVLIFLKGKKIEEKHIVKMKQRSALEKIEF